MRDGIAIAGSILVDKINEISAYPKSGELTKILSVQKAVGGCVPNVAIDIKRIAPNLTVKAVGKIGNDEEGEFVKTVLLENGVDTSAVVYGDDKTSFTEVMSIKGGQRTFFTYAGASADFGASDFSLQQLNVKMFHLGYFLLLDKIDSGDGERILKEAKENGIITSIDLISENSDRYSLVLPCLKYVDNLIINEIEAGALVGETATEDNVITIAQKLKQLGVGDRVIIHMPKLSVCVSNEGAVTLPSYKLPDGFIKGTTGAGDAFCAGSLYGIYKGWDDLKILEFASSSAVSALSAVDAISGVRTEEEIVKLCKDLKRS